jgi:DnaJ family protein A protein 2
MVKDTTLYNRLEVPPDADDNIIKKAFNRLSKTWHPDKHGDEKKEEATEKFKEITEAKEILLDKEKRELYDNIGMDIFKQQGPDGGNPFGDFGNMFGQGFPFGGMPRQQGPENIHESIDVTLEQLYKEESVNYTYKQKVYCNKCDGEGSKDGKPTICAPCGGKGMRVQLMRMGPMVQQSVAPCHVCNGKGKTINEANKCEQCHGKCYNIKEKTIMIPLKAGLSHGNKINLESKGHQFKNAKTDLILSINELPHKIFKRYQNDLFVDIDLKLYQSLFGFDKIITHLDGRQLHISSSSKSDFNMIRKISNEGMKQLNSNNKGDMYIRFHMTVPNFSNLPTDMKQQLKSLLQSFDKMEVSQENQITKMPNLVKTILTDCKQETSDNILNLMDKLKNKRNVSDDEDTIGGQPQCVQQ